MEVEEERSMENRNEEVMGESEESEKEKGFKMPILPCSPAGFKLPSLPSSPALPKAPEKDQEEAKEETDEDDKETEVVDNSTSTAKPSIPSIPLNYEEPSWGGLPAPGYSLEILKNGTIAQTVSLEGKSMFTIGRLPQSDLYMEHPSLSRHHAVLQYKAEASQDLPAGFHLYDLDSTHGTWHNKNKCFPRKYYGLRVGHMMKFGGSTRLVLLQGPEQDQEEESALGMTELMAVKEEKARRKKEEEEARRREREAEKEKEEEKERSRGVSWGMEEDGEEEFPDMEKNPFAELADNEALYVDDPKKMIEKWFDREGYDFDKSMYQVTERGYAHFHCRLDLPADCSPNFAEAEVKGGKKKEAEVQCALEACRVLDRLGILRPSSHARMERKVKQWEEDDFYASDEDEFMDRTGDIGRKRRMRMKMAGKAEGDTIETYASLMVKHAKVEEDILSTEKQLKQVLEKNAAAEKRSNSGDLDSYLAELKKGAQVDKETVTKLKVRASELVKEKDRLVKLVNLARPAAMPELQPSERARPKAGIMIGRRPGKGLGLAAKVKSVSADSVNKPLLVKSEETKVLEAFLEKEEGSRRRPGEERELAPIGYEEAKPAKHEVVRKERMGAGEVNSLVVKGPQIPDHIKNAVTEEKGKGGDEISEAVENEEEEEEVKLELKPVLGTLDVLNIQRAEVEGDLDQQLEEEEKKRKRGDRGLRRAKKKKEEEEDEEEKETHYRVGADRQYDVWMPPQDQSGDGRTTLNEKLGY